MTTDPLLFCSRMPGVVLQTSIKHLKCVRIGRNIAINQCNNSVGQKSHTKWEKHLIGWDRLQMSGFVSAYKLGDAIDNKKCHD